MNKVWVVLDFESCIQGKDYRMVVGVFDKEPIEYEDDDQYCVIEQEISKYE